MLNILFVTYGIDPFHPVNGSIQRTSLLLRACSKIGQTDLLCFNGGNGVTDVDGIRVIKRTGSFPVQKQGRLKKFANLLGAFLPSRCYPTNTLLAQEVDKVVAENNYDLIVVRYVSEAVGFGLLKYKDRLVIDIDDSPIDRAIADAKHAKTLRNKFYYRLYAMQLKVALHRIVSSCRCTFFSNKQQADTWNSHFLPNVPYYEAKTVGMENQIAGRLLFVGELSYPPNYLGVDYFLENIYPMIRKNHANVSFHIAGRIFDEALIAKWNAIPGVTVMGFVPDIRKEYAEAQMVVIPIYTGAGTCIKVLEAMQMGRSCVTTEYGARGYEDVFENGQDYIVAKNDEEFINAVTSLLEDNEQLTSISTHAQETLHSQYSHEVFMNIVKNSICK